jgi:hypothetical protein
LGLSHCRRCQQLLELDRVAPSRNADNDFDGKLKLRDSRASQGGGVDKRLSL